MSAHLIPFPGADAQAGDTNSLVAGNTAFALSLYDRLKTAPGNLFFSPFSISDCLALTYAGARGKTASQMAQTLHFSGDQNLLCSQFGELQKIFNATPQKREIVLNLANGLWAGRSQPFLPDFLRIIREYYGAQINQVDFRVNAESIRVEINDWVAGKTQGKIARLIPPGTLNQATGLVLVNAIYFKGQWSRQFNKTNTTMAPFFVANGEKVQAPLMTVSASFKYAETEGLQVLELPYRGGELSMVVLLPGETGGLKGMEDQLKLPQLDTWLAQCRLQKVDVFLPRFKMAGQLALAETLAGMGMPAAFSPDADFSGMDGTHQLRISAVIHQAFVDANEEGAEAAAAFGSVIALTAVRPRPTPTFRADHPFIFLIRDTHSGSILFLGRLDDPTT